MSEEPLLRVVEGPETGASLSLAGRGRVVIGRRTTADFQILDPGISGIHCELVSEDGEFTLRDLGSSNGTFLNGRQVDQSPLRHRDVIQLGQTAIQFIAAAVTESQGTGVDTVVVEDRWTQGDSDIIERYSATGSFQAIIDKQQHAPNQLKRALQAIYQVAIVLNEVGGAAERLCKILELILATYKADRGCVVLRVGESSACEIAASVDNRGGAAPFEISHTILGRTMEQGESILTLDQPAAEMFDSSQSIGEQRVKSILCVPISTQERQIGALYFDSLSRIGAFNRDDLQLLTCVARLLGESIEKDRLGREADATRRKLRLVLEEAPVGVFALDQQMRFVVWTGHLTRLLGHSPEEARRAGLSLFVADPARVEIVLDQAEQRGAYEGELHCRRKDGSAFQGRLALARLPGSEDMPIIGCLTDISVREKLKRELMEQQKLASLGLLVAGITHDLKNFLTSLYGTAQLAQQFPRYQEQLVTSALTTSQSSVALIENLLGFVVGGAELESIDLGELVEATLSLIETQLRHNNIEVVRELQAVPAVRARKSFVQDMLLNLILNARKAMPDGGTLRIAVGAPAPERVRMEVADSGIGIEPDKLPYIFDPFFTQQKAMGGTGLGLYMVQHIVEEHGGRIRVASQPGRGTTFTIEFPVAGARPALDDTAEIVMQRRTRQIRQIHVLVGELDGETIARFNDCLGSSWDLAGDGATLMRLAGGLRYDAVFLASDLPGEPAPAEALRALKQRGVPVYLVHWTPAPPAELDAVAGTLVRPVHLEELRGLLLGLSAGGRGNQPA